MKLHNEAAKCNKEIEGVWGYKRYSYIFESLQLLRAAFCLGKKRLIFLAMLIE